MDRRSSSTPVQPTLVTSVSTNSLQRSSTSPTSRVTLDESDVERMPPSQEGSPLNLADTLSSVESLEDGGGGGDMVEFEDDPDLAPLMSEAEAWSVTVDKKVLKRMNAKDIKRQDAIWELIQTELHHYRVLKTLQKLYKQGMVKEQIVPAEILNQLFPRLDDLVDFHMQFYNQLQQLQSMNEDQYIEEIGHFLIGQFSGDSATQMADLYGQFCSQHKTSVKIYKDFLKSDRKFYSFIKQCDMSSYARKRQFPGFLLLISQRITKYPILIDNILKSTKDKKDRENVVEALKLSKEIIIEVDKKVDGHMKQLRLIEICDKIDSRTTLYMGSKFKKTDILEKNRKLIHEGVLGLKTSRGKVLEVLAVILSDLILFLQETNQKYTFATQDTKPSTLSLYRLLVREKCDTRDNRGIYLISQNKQEAEMYELVCKSSEDRHSWATIMRDAILRCPEQEMKIVNTEQGKRIQEVQDARTARILDIIELLQEKDQQIKIVCEEKNRLFSELFTLYNHEPSRMKSHDEETTEHEVSDVLLAAIDEASRLTTLLQHNDVSSVANLSRSVSSVGEHVSSSYALTPPVPKRAETFAGFDSHDPPQKGAHKKHQSPSLLQHNFHCHDNIRSSPASLMDVTDVDDVTLDKPCLGSGLSYSHTPVISSSQTLYTESADDAAGKLSDRSSDQGSSVDEQDSLGDLVMSSPNIIPDHVISSTQLNNYLQTIVHLSAQQGTAIESYRAQVHEMREKNTRLMAEIDTMQANRHNQLEELRNLQESIKRERRDWDKERDAQKELIEQERQLFLQEQVAFEQAKAELKTSKELLQQQREVLQIQIDLYGMKDKISMTPQEQPVRTDSVIRGVTPGVSLSPQIDGLQIIHKRSASAELPTSKNSPHPPVSQEGTLRNKPQPSRMSFQSLPSANTSTCTSPPTAGEKQQLPLHLHSCTNERKAQNTNKHTQKMNIPQMLPYKLASTVNNNNLPLPSVQSSNMKNDAGLSSSGLGKKLAKPFPRNRAASQPCIAKNALPVTLQESKSSSRLNEADIEKKDSSVIYF